MAQLAAAKEQAATIVERIRAGRQKLIDSTCPFFPPLISVVSLLLPGHYLTSSSLLRNLCGTFLPRCVLPPQGNAPTLLTPHFLVSTSSSNDYYVGILEKYIPLCGPWIVGQFLPCSRPLRRLYSLLIIKPHSLNSLLDMFSPTIIVIEISFQLHKMVA